MSDSEKRKQPDGAQRTTAGSFAGESVLLASASTSLCLSVCWLLSISNPSRAADAQADYLQQIRPICASGASPATDRSSRKVVCGSIRRSWRSKGATLAP